MICLDLQTIWPYGLALSLGLAFCAGVRVWLAVRRVERDQLVRQHALEMARRQGAR